MTDSKLEEARKKLEKLLKKPRTTPKPSSKPIQPKDDAPLSGKQRSTYLVDYAKSDKWPQAVPEWNICSLDNEEDKKERAQGILDFLVKKPLKGKKFLDFGCGEGHIAQIAASKAKLSVGYDIVKSGQLGYSTTDLASVQKQAPFDVILLYDVSSDHTKDPLWVLNEAGKLLANNGVMILRCHPWVARHGGHLYHELNKAFIHLVFSEEELKQHFDVSLDVSCIQRVTDLTQYDRWIKQSQLTIASRRVETQSAEKWFETPVVGLSYGKQLSACFIDYEATK